MTDALTNEQRADWRKPPRGMFAHGSSNAVDFRDYLAAVDEIERLSAIVERNKTSATHRLHNLCDGLAEDADKSPFTREEWDRVDRQTVRLQYALRGLIDAVRNIEIDKAPWDAHIALPLANSYRALKHEDPLTALDRLTEKQP